MGPAGNWEPGQGYHMAGFCHHGCLATPVIQEIQWAKPKPHQTIIFHGFTEDFLCSQWEIHYWGNLFGGIFWWRSWGKSKFLMGKKCSHWRTSIYVYIIEDRYICSLSFMNYSPPARWGLLDFIRAVLLLLLCLRLLTRRLLLAVQIPVGTAGPPPRAPDPSGHCRTSTASCRSQWALPDLNRDFQVAVGTAGPQPRLPDRSGHCRTSTATSRSQWALPDLNGKNVRKDVR